MTAQQPREKDPQTLIGEALQEKIEELYELEAGWDGPESLPVNRASLAKLLGVLGVAMAAAPDLMPALVPMHSGGVQAEWHARGRSVEIGVEPNGQVFALAAVGEDYHIDAESAEVLPDDAMQALRDFLPYMRSPVRAEEI